MLPYQLIGDITVILPGEFLTDSTLHETRQRRQHVDGRVNLSVVELTVDKDLALRNVTSQIGDRMGNICK